MNVLIVEDDSVFAGQLTEVLEGWGHRVEWAGTAKEAGERFARRIPDLVLLDIFLPDARGDDLIPWFRECSPEIQIISITGYNSRELELRVRQQGVLFYMIKPIEINDLRSLLEYLSAKGDGSVLHQGAIGARGRGR
ncbi:MAG: response regulator [Deltaproteobacteria bacterium]|nr:response regulator [Deltaproteobacteria bacterium]